MTAFLTVLLVLATVFNLLLGLHTLFTVSGAAHWLGLLNIASAGYGVWIFFYSLPLIRKDFRR